MKQIFLLVLYLGSTVLASSSEADNPGTLKLVHVFFRHGSRTPELKDKYPTDPHHYETFLPMGWGQLTNAGKASSFRLGEMLRSRYDSFLGSIYTPEVVDAWSTDYDRTKMTLMLVLAGLFPPSLSQTWHDDIPWIPIPYQFDKDKEDFSLRRPTHYCPAYVNLLERVLTSGVVQDELKTHRKLFQYVAEHTEKPINKLMDVFSVYQTLNAEETMNLTLPEWTKSVYPEEIYAVAGRQCLYENYNDVLKRLNGGRMLGKVIKHMQHKSADELPAGRKIYLYSGHENNVINILAALNLFEPAHVPRYNAAVMVELHHMPDENEFAVKVLYSKDLDHKPETLQLEGCDIMCPLSKFVQITEPHVPVNYTAECGSSFNLD